MSGVGSHSDASSVEDSRLRSHMSLLHGFIACHPTRMQDAVSRDIVYRDEIAASASQEAMPSDPRVITTFSTSRRAYKDPDRRPRLMLWLEFVPRYVLLAPTVPGRGACNVL